MQWIKFGKWKTAPYGSRKIRGQKAGLYRDEDIPTSEWEPRKKFTKSERLRLLQKAMRISTSGRVGRLK